MYFVVVIGRVWNSQNQLKQIRRLNIGSLCRQQIMCFCRDIELWCKFNRVGFHSTIAILKHSSRVSSGPSPKTIERLHKGSTTHRASRVLLNYRLSSAHRRLVNKTGGFGVSRNVRDAEPVLKVCSSKQASKLKEKVLNETHASFSQYSHCPLARCRDAKGRHHQRVNYFER